MCTTKLQNKHYSMSAAVSCCLKISWDNCDNNESLFLWRPSAECSDAGGVRTTHITDTPK